MSLEFFIKKPVLAFVLSFLFMLAGIFCVPLIPVNEYPNIAPPQISVSTFYTGASSDLVESSITIPLEEELNGLEGVRYLSSSSNSNGTSRIKITLEPNRDPDQAIFDIQNKIKTVESRLPREVIRNGIVVKKTSSALVLVFGLYSENHRYNKAYLSNYLNRYITGSLKRVKGVSDVSVFGSRDYAMRIWLNPDQLASRKITARDIIQALKEQNLQVAGGEIGQPPIQEEQKFQISLKILSRLKTPEEFANIIIKKTENSLVKLKDVARIEMGAEDYSTFLRFNGNKNVVGVLINHLPDASAIEVSKQIIKKLDLLAKDFPQGIKYRIAFDTTKAVKKSIKEVFFSLVQAIFLVILVIYLFLLDGKSTLIPAITIPISLVSSFFFIKIFNFSINNLTLFGLTLSTGVVVDDAIVVVENISRLIQSKNISPVKAAIQTMKEISGAVIATSIVLIAVFVPIAFFSGSTGRLYNQFALTITFCIFVSTFNALTLAPAISALILKKKEKASRNIIFKKIEKALEKLNFNYLKLLKKSFRNQKLVIISLILFLCWTVLLFKSLPGSFVPEEDRGYFIVAVETSPGSSLQKTSQTMKKVESLLLSQPEIKNLFAITGFSFFGSGSNKGIMFPSLQNKKERKKKHSVQAVIKRIRPKLFEIPGAVVIPFVPPPIRGLGSVGGFEFKIKAESANFSLEDLSEVTNQIIIKASQNKNLANVFTSFKVNTPQLELSLDRDKAKSLGVDLEEIFSSMQTFFASVYVNDFDLQNKIYKVYVQADQSYRDSRKDINQIYVRSSDNQQKMIPISNFLKIKEKLTAQSISHFNLSRAVTLNGSAAFGKSLGIATKEMQKIAQETLPRGMTFEWSGLVREQIEAGNQSLIIFLLGLLVVFLVLAAQYESFITPVIIMLAVPLAIFGGVLFQFLRGLNNDIYCQIGLIMLVGLASKNSILIVEFANQIRKKRIGVLRSVIKASILRFRAILMTSFSFILGVLPLVFASGPGSASRNSLGTIILGGMIISTILSLFVVPVLYFKVTNTRKNC